MINAVFQDEKHPFQSQIDNISNFTNPYWLTFSPDGATEPIRADRFIDKWRLKFIKFTKAIKDGYFVMEVQPGTGRFHWHIMLDVLDLKRLMIFVKGIAYEPIRQMQYKIYKGAPAGGIQYLFKDIDETTLHLDRNVPIITCAQLLRLCEEEYDNKRLNRSKKSHFDIVNPGIPKCFRPDSKHSSSDEDSEAD